MGPPQGEIRFGGGVMQRQENKKKMGNWEVRAPKNGKRGGKEKKIRLN